MSEGKAPRPCTIASLVDPDRHLAAFHAACIALGVRPTRAQARKAIKGHGAWKAKADWLARMAAGGTRP